MGSRNLKEYNLWQGNHMTEAALRTPLCIYMTTKTLLRPMLHRLSPNEGRMHFFALLPHQLTKYSNAMATWWSVWQATFLWLYGTPRGKPRALPTLTQWPISHLGTFHFMELGS